MAQVPVSAPVSAIQTMLQQSSRAANNGPIINRDEAFIEITGYGLRYLIRRGPAEFSSNPVGVSRGHFRGRYFSADPVYIHGASTVRTGYERHPRQAQALKMSPS
jgi:hypothetical protein